MSIFEQFSYKRYDFTTEYSRMYGSMPRSITFVVTEACNLCCSYCYQHNKTARVMPFEVAKKCVDVLFDEDARNSPYINPDEADSIVLDFIGGEPMLEIKLIDKIVDYFLEKAIMLNHRWAIKHMISMSTNGTKYFEPEVQAFLKKHDGRVSIGITIDGDETLHDSCRKYPDGRGSYREAAAAFHAILKQHHQDGTKLTLAPANIMYLASATKHMFQEFDIHALHANCVFERGWTNEHATIMYEQLKELADWILDNNYEARYRLSLFDASRYVPMSPEDNQNWCGGTGKMLAFGVNGEIYPCQRYSPASLGPDVKPLIVGDISHGIEKTSDECATCAMLRDITRRSQSTDECWECPIAAGCAWCSAYNYETFGTPNKRATFICCMHKAEALANVYYWNKLARKLGVAERFKMYLPKAQALEIISEDEYKLLLNLSAQG